MMRITNSMMMNTSKLNINSNKVSVDRLNTQMSTQKKITKPSDNPLIAIKSLRLSTTLSQINQYNNNNIKDAQSWMDVTETALTNMKDILHDAYRLCVNGSTDTLTEEDRDTILAQLKGLSKQLYAEANADYADRTVFSGYKTNSTVTFEDALEASLAKYQISERLSASDIAVFAYYANKLDTPTASEIDPAPGNTQPVVKTPQEEVLKRLRLAYAQQKNLNSFFYNYSVDTSTSSGSGTTTGNVEIKASTDPAEQTFQWRSLRKDGAFTYQADATGQMSGASLEDMNGYVLNISQVMTPPQTADGKDVPPFTVNDPSITQTTRTSTSGSVTTTRYIFTDESGRTVFEAVQEEDTANNTKTGWVADAQGNVVNLVYDNGSEKLQTIQDPQGNTIGTNLVTATDTITVTKADGTTALTATVKPASADPDDPAQTPYYEVLTADKNLTTELHMKTMTQLEFEGYLTELAANPDETKKKYENTLIYLPDSGELVFGSELAETMSSEFATLGVDYEKEGFTKGETRPEMYFNCTNKTDKANWIKYTNFDADNQWIYQNINYAVSANQDMTINTQIHDVVNADCYRDLAELTDIVQETIDAHATVANIESLLASTDYVAEDQQAYLQDCLENAKTQMAYMDDHLQKVFGTQITHFEKYMSRVNLAITDVGTRGDQLSLAENRISNQKTTFTELKSKNEDEEMSDVTIDYTSAYSAYQASLQAAGKIDDMSLLDYL